MAKTKLPKITADLCQKRPPATLLDIGNTKLDFEVEIETKAPNTAKLDRYSKVAALAVKKYKDTIESEVERLAEDIRKLNGVLRNPEEPEAKRKKAKAEAEKKASATSASVQKACKSLKDAVEEAVEGQIRREHQDDANLREARVFCAVKGTFSVIKIGKEVALIAGTGGANLKAWVSLCKEIAKLAQLVHDASKDEPKLRKELLEAIGAYCTLKQRRFAEKQKADKDWKKKLKLIAKEIYKSEGKSAKKAEESRKKYRNSVTKTRQSADKLGTGVDKAKEALKKAPDIIKGAKVGAKMIELQRDAKALNDTLLSAQQFADDMAFLLTEAGVTVDDRTEMQKLKALDNLDDVYKAAKDVKAAADDIVAIVEAL